MTHHKNETGQHLFDTFPISSAVKQGDAFLLLLFKSVLECGIKSGQLKREYLTLNGKLQLLVYADDVKPVAENTHNYISFISR